jgi:hypothetical protein
MNENERARQQIEGYFDALARDEHLPGRMHTHRQSLEYWQQILNMFCSNGGVMEAGLSRQTIFASLIRSPHGELKSYLPVAQAAAKQDAEFFAHLVSWDAKNGQIRDAHVALPMCSLREPSFSGELLDNSLAHLALLSPKMLVQAWEFGKEIGTPLHGMALKRLIHRYLQARESSYGRWERTVMSHRSYMRRLYAISHFKGCGYGRALMTNGPWLPGSTLEVISRLKDMEPTQAAGEIMGRKIPYKTARGALGNRSANSDISLALINGMSPAELMNNAKSLERDGVQNNAVLKSAFQAGLAKAAVSDKVSTFRTTRAADAMQDGAMKSAIQATQEKQIDRLGQVEGNWLVLGDMSPSMRDAIEGARRVAATLARMVKGKVHLIFFHNSIRYIDATGKTYDELLALTSNVVASGAGTSIGVGLSYAMEKKFDFDAIAICSDAQENTLPMFAERLKRYQAMTQAEPPVYLYRFLQYGRGAADKDLSVSMREFGLEMQEYDLRGGYDSYSLPNLVSTMRVKKFSLIDAILDTPLLTLDEVFNETKEIEHATDRATEIA